MHIWTQEALSTVRKVMTSSLLVYVRNLFGFWVIDVVCPSILHAAVFLILTCLIQPMRSYEHLQIHTYVPIVKYSPMRQIVEDVITYYREHESPFLQIAATILYLDRQAS